MKIYTSYGDLAFKTFDFPDGQPHFKLETHDKAQSVTIESAIRNPKELFQVQMAANVLSVHYEHLSLDIRYMMAARMDRSIDSYQPFTCGIVTQTLGSCHFDKIRILDPHSDVCVKSLGAEAVLPFDVVSQILETLGGDTVVVIPDKGATTRSRLLGKGSAGFVQMLKHRDMQTGAILGMTLEDPKAVYNRRCLIVDDICDGGATFVTAAEILKEAGAAEVFLYITHGIFSKTLPLPGIKNIFVTDSFKEWQYVPHCSLVCIPVSMRNMS